MNFSKYIYIYTDYTCASLQYELFYMCFQWIVINIFIFTMVTWI